MGIGFWSAINAEYPVWAITEMALWLSVWLGLVSAVAIVVVRSHGLIESLLMATFALLAMMMATQFLASYIFVLLNKAAVFYSNLLVSGFSNIRFQGQVITMLLPMVLFLTSGHKSKSYSKYLNPNMIFITAWSVASLLWMMLIVVGTRGSIFALLSVAGLMFFIHEARPVAVKLLITALIGVFLSVLLFDLLPLAVRGESFVQYLQRWGTEAKVTATFTYSSGRMELWQHAWQMTQIGRAHV